MNSLCFYLSGNILFQLYFWRIVLLDIKNSWFYFFSFEYHAIAIWPLLFLRSHYYIVVFLDVMSRFSAFKIFSFSSFIMMYLDVVPFVFLLGVLGVVHCFHQIWDIFSHYVLKYVSPLLFLLSSQNPILSTVGHMVWRVAPKSVELRVSQWLRWTL